MRMGKLAVAGIAFAGAALVLSGCFVLKAPPTAKQVKKKPRVAVAFTVCESDTQDPTVCPHTGNADNDPDDGPGARPLIAFRVPRGTAAPRRIRPVRGDFGGLFRRSAAYRRSLNQNAPRPKRTTWIGYAGRQSPPLKGDGDAGLKGRFRVTFGVPKRLVGKRFRAATVIGATELEPDAIDCGPDPFAPVGEFNDTICINDPARGELRNVNVRVRRR